MTIMADWYQLWFHEWASFHGSATRSSSRQRGQRRCTPVFFHMTPGRDAKTSLRFVTLSPNTFWETKPQMVPIDQNNPKYWFPEFSFDSGPNLQPCNNIHLRFDSSEGEETCQWDPQQALLFDVFRLFFYNTVPINKAKSKPLGSVLWQALQGHDWKSRGIERQPGEQQQWPDCCKLS